MQSRSCLIIGLLMLIAGHIIAQDSSLVIKPHHPDVEDFIVAVKSADYLTSIQYVNRVGVYLIEVTESEFAYRYANVADYLTLHDAFEVFKKQSIFMPAGAGNIAPAANYDLWIVWLLERWFTENSMTLIDGQVLTFDPFTILVQVKDFDNDNKPEIFLEVTYGSDPIDYHHYMTAIHAESGYEIYSAPFPFFTKRFGGDGRHRSQKGIIKEIDSDSDGQIDWLFSYKPDVTGRDGTSGMIPNTASYAVTWKNDTLSLLFHTRSIGDIDNSDAYIKPDPPMNSVALQEKILEDRDIYNAFRLEEYEIALQIAREAVPEDDIDTARWLYWEALILDVMGQADESTTIYHQIVREYPGTPWAVLALFHYTRT